MAVRSNKVTDDTRSVSDVQVDKTTENKPTYYKKCDSSCKNIIEALRSVGETDISFTHRKMLAVTNNVTTSNSNLMNGSLLSLLRDGKLLRC